MTASRRQRSRPSVRPVQEKPKPIERSVVLAVDDKRPRMTVWVVARGEQRRIFNDGNEAFAYRGQLSKANGHHKRIPIHAETWSEDQWHSQVAFSETGDS